VLQQRWSLKGKTGFDEQGWARDVLLFRGYSERPRLSARYRSPGQTTLTDELDRRVTRGTVYIRRDLVHTAIEKALCATLTDSGAVSALGQASRATNSPEASRNGSHAILEGIRQQLQEQRKQLAALMALWAAADEEERLAIRATQAGVKRRITDLKRDLPAAQGSTPPSLDLTEIIPHLAVLAEDRERVWSETPGPVKRQVVRSCVAEVEAIAEPVPGRTPWRREVGEVRIRDWLRGW